jgi:hypothetical protein
MKRSMAAELDPLQANRPSVVAWALWLVAGGLLSLATVIAVRTGCSPTRARDVSALAAVTFTGLATAVSLWRSIRAWWALAISLAVSAAVGGVLFFVGLFSWINHCAN